MSEIQENERKVKDTLSDGERLINDNHPAKQTVQAYVTAVKNQWEWILNITICMEKHIQHLNMYKKVKYQILLVIRKNFNDFIAFFFFFGNVVSLFFALMLS